MKVPHIDDAAFLPTTEGDIIRPKTEIESKVYPLAEQEVHSLEICFWCYSLFDAIYNESLLAYNVELPREVLMTFHSEGPRFQKGDWAAAKAKIYDFFKESVTRKTHAKYLHYLFGRVEVVRGTRLQRLYFLVPESVRALKDHSLVKAWQESFVQEVKRSSPEEKIDGFSDRVMSEYITFVEHQYELLKRPWPLNRAGEVISFSLNAIIFLTILINIFLIAFYNKAYTADDPEAQWHSFGEEAWKSILFSTLSYSHLLFSLLWTLFYIVSYSGWTMSAQMQHWKANHPKLSYILTYWPIRFALSLYFFFADNVLLYRFIYVTFSYLGCRVNPLFFSFHVIDICTHFQILQKVMEAVMSTYTQLMGTIFLGFSVSYCFVVVGFMAFGHGYDFADKDNYECTSLVTCLKGHLDYGFRSAPLWRESHQDWTTFFFDYFYYLFIILILSAIISGIIIDTFAEKRNEAAAKSDDMLGKCFICSLDKTLLERKRIQFSDHIYEDHYMWAYARFLLYLHQTSAADLTGPESYIKEQWHKNDRSFFPLGRCMALEARELSETASLMDRAVTLKDFEGLRASMGRLTDDEETIKHKVDVLDGKIGELAGRMAGLISEQKRMMQQQEIMDVPASALGPRDSIR